LQEETLKNKIPFLGFTGFKHSALYFVAFLDEVKQRLYRTTVLNYELEKHILEGWADIDSDTWSDSEQQRGTSLTGVTTQQGQVSDPEQPGLFGPTVTQLTESVSYLESAVDSWGKATAKAHTTGHVTSGHEALILPPVLGKELADEKLWTPDEQHFKQLQKLISLATKWAVIKLVDDDNKSHPVKIQTLMPWLYDKEKLETAFARSKEKQPNLYLPYDKRLRAWQNNTMA